MKIELALQRTQLAARATVQNCFRDAERPAETRNDSSDGGNFHLRGRVADEIHRAVAHFSLHGNPALVHGNPRALKLDRFETPVFEKLLEATLSLSAGFAD